MCLCPQICGIFSETAPLRRSIIPPLKAVRSVGRKERMRITVIKGHEYPRRGFCTSVHSFLMVLTHLRLQNDVPLPTTFLGYCTYNFPKFRESMLCFLLASQTNIVIENSWILLCTCCQTLLNRRSFLHCTHFFSALWSFSLALHILPELMNTYHITSFQWNVFLHIFINNGTELLLIPLNYNTCNLAYYKLFAKK